MTEKEYFDLRSVYEKEGQSVLWGISNVLCGTNYIDRSTLIATAYILLKASDEAIVLDSIDSFCDSVNADDDRRSFLNLCLCENWQMVAGQRYRYSADALKSIILFYEDRELRFGDEVRTPLSLSRLSCKLFGFKDGDDIADFGIGSGAFTIEAFLTNPSLKFYGVEINASLKELAEIRLEVLGYPMTIEHANIFDLMPEKHKYQYIFSNYPFGLRLRDIGIERNRLAQRLYQKVSEFTKSMSSDWFFNAAIIECLKEDGKGIAIMTNGSTWNTLDRTARKYFIENGYLEAVISLPERMLENTGISTTMVVLSKHNTKTMLVDATGLCEKGRRFNTFTDEQIESIIFATKNETANSRYISRDEFEANDFVINPTRYLTKEVFIENGVPFGDIIKTITRGAPIKASDLDEMISDKPTDYQYLMLANIQRGQIDNNLPYIKDIQENLKKYCLKDNSLILSKNGFPFKVAVAKVPSGKTILANGNLYIIEIDEEKADPYFVKVFLESEKGTALLKSITVGATIPNIGVESLKKILIPQISLDEQRKIVALYLAKTDEIAIYKRKLEKAYEELSHIYDNKG